MATDTTITALPTGNPVDGTEVLAVDQGTDTIKITTKQVADQVSKASLSLGNVDNTHDADKPISTAQATAFNDKADKTAVALKADKTAVALKADQTAVDLKADKTAVALKADKTDLNLKADKTALASTDSNVTALNNRTTGVSYTPAVPGSPDSNLKTDHIGMATPVRLEGVQAVPTGPADRDKELATFKTVGTMISQAMSADKEIGKLKGNNPSMKMEMEAAGHSAQMQVIDLDTGYPVATMEYLKATKEFMFVLSDPNTGVAKAELEIKQDGHAYMGGKRLIVEGELERPAVVSPYTATPTKAELIDAAKLLPHYINDATFWGKDHDFYVRDNPQTKMVLVKYRPEPTSVDESTAGLFFFEKLTKAS